MQDTIDAITRFIDSLAAQYLTALPTEAVRYGLAVLLGLLALLLLLFALRLFRSGSRNSRATRNNIPRTLQHQGVIVDLLNSVHDEDVAVRVVVTSISSGRVKCEIIERLDVIKATEGQEVVCVFAPMRMEEGKINSFNATLVESDKSGKRPDRIILSAPTSYSMIPRRKHARKRVADQQFIRVKLWVANPHSSDISFEDATPHIGVNSFASSGPDQTANAVINISSGGLGLSVNNQVIPETCAVGATVTINLFMFNFREKTFKPYWYTAEVRSMEEGRPGFTRMGLEFIDTGYTCGQTGCLKWNRE